LALRAWFLPASSFVINDILKKQHVPASFISEIAKFQKLTVLLEIDNNCTANGRRLDAYAASDLCALSAEFRASL
jgi:hypothetical protein